ncbi:helix-turn-helix domain-containing protein [Lachnospiraceae bacterium MD1]|uniref:Helix-turn-helix domain-containing protein n=1 Tax=Variimorphobacter saccharofermentans TaxID=2755051 RepID=A0A839JXP2_9FIRM|nr:helix-turn-helix domain-containing protein [Variimorphobacter saccharofermentans]MBB2182176.1 helix-turn-helix domain-containing protein [Variimorphobacter saccharofermentans]
MDCYKVGNLISCLRKEKGLTQKQLADVLNISDKTISKWERGLGCPDVSLLHELSEALNVNIEKILLGDLDPNNTDGGNMKKIRFYICNTCGNIITSTSDAELSCCGRKLSPLIAKPSDDIHNINVEINEDDYYITFSHEMSKTHYINFVAYVNYDRVLLIKLYPEQNGEVRIPRMGGGKLYFSCNQHGLWAHKG